MTTHLRTTRRLAAMVLAAGLLLTACGGSGTGDVAGPAPGDETPVAGDETPAPGGDSPADAEPQDPATDEPASDEPATGADCSAGELSVAAVEQEGLPDAVAELRRFLIDAALRCDEQLLRTAVDEGDTNYSFGGDDDAIGYWRSLEEQGERPYAALVEMLLTTPALADGEVAYVWPRVTTGRPQDTTDEAWQELSSFYDQERIAELRRSDTGYLGWRVGIRPDGTWAFFVQGD